MSEQKPYFKDGTHVRASGEYNNRYKVVSKVPVRDSQVYYCYDNTENTEVVLKAERIGLKRARLQEEYKFYERLKTCHDFAILKDWFIGIDHKFLVLEKRGIDLRRHYRSRRKIGLWKDTDLDGYAVQMIEGLQKCHSYGVLHLDPKPNNYVLDSNDSTKVYLIDFDCAKELFDGNGEHIPFRTGLKSNEIFGNRAYISKYSHDFEEQSRRDDMIFLGYSLIWMARDGLPWNEKQSTDFSSRDLYYQYIRDQKVNHSFEQLCRSPDGKPFPQLVQYMEYCNELKFTEEPDYHYLISLFTSEDKVLQS